MKIGICSVCKKEKFVNKSKKSGKLVCPGCYISTDYSGPGNLGICSRCKKEKPVHPSPNGKLFCHNCYQEYKAAEEAFRKRMLGIYDKMGPESEGLYWVRKGKEYFHIKRNGKPAYAERYDWVGNFSEGFARARKNGKEFHIRKDGKPAYQERFDYVGSFCQGIAMAYKDDFNFYIYPNGKPAESLPLGDLPDDEKP